MKWELRDRHAGTDLTIHVFGSLSVTLNKHPHFYTALSLSDGMLEDPPSPRYCFLFAAICPSTTVLAFWSHKTTSRKGKSNPPGAPKSSVTNGIIRSISCSILKLMGMLGQGSSCGMETLSLDLKIHAGCTLAGAPSSCQTATPFSELSPPGCFSNPARQGSLLAATQEHGLHSLLPTLWVLTPHEGL